MMHPEYMQDYTRRWKRHQRIKKIKNGLLCVVFVGIGLIGISDVFL